jgi:O-antigen/teichoic acid export membrane protein
MELINKLIGSKISHNVGWSVLGSLSVRLISPVFSIAIARQLHPQDYGTFAIASSIIAFFSMFGDFGLSQAIIANQGAKSYQNLQFSIQLAISGASYLIIFAGANIAQSFYHLHNLSIVLKLMGLTLLMAIIFAPIDTQIKKEMNFKFLFYRMLLTSLASGSIALWMAFSGYGVYSLVANGLVASVVGGGFMYAARPWIPKLEWDPTLAKSLFKFCGHFTFQKLCGFVILKSDLLIIGKNVGVAGAGIYRMSQTLSNIVTDMLFPQIDQVAYSDFSKNQNKRDYINKRYFQYVYFSAFVSLFVSISIFYFSPFIVPFVLSPKWSGTIPYIRILCIPLAVGPFSTFNTTLSRVMGFQKVYSYYAFAYGLSMVLAVLIGSLFSLWHVALLWCIVALLAPITSCIVLSFTQKIVPLSIRHFMLAFIPYAWAAFALSQV